MWGIIDWDSYETIAVFDTEQEANDKFQDFEAVSDDEGYFSLKNPAWPYGEWKLNIQDIGILHFEKWSAETVIIPGDIHYEQNPHS